MFSSKLARSLPSIPGERPIFKYMASDYDLNVFLRKQDVVVRVYDLEVGMLVSNPSRKQVWDQESHWTACTSVSLCLKQVYWAYNCCRILRHKHQVFMMSSDLCKEDIIWCSLLKSDHTDKEHNSWSAVMNNKLT